MVKAAISVETAPRRKRKVAEEVLEETGLVTTVVAVVTLAETAPSLERKVAEEEEIGPVTTVVAVVT